MHNQTNIYSLAGFSTVCFFSTSFYFPPPLFMFYVSPLLMSLTSSFALPDNLFRPLLLLPLFSTSSFLYPPTAVCLEDLWSCLNRHEERPNTFWFVFICCLHYWIIHVLNLRRHSVIVPEGSWLWLQYRVTLHSLDWHHGHITPPWPKVSRVHTCTHECTHAQRASQKEVSKKKFQTAKRAAFLSPHSRPICLWRDTRHFFPNSFLW